MQLQALAGGDADGAVGILTSQAVDGQVLVGGETAARDSTANHELPVPVGLFRLALLSNVAVVLLMAVVWRRAAVLAAGCVTILLISTGIANPNIQNAFLKRSGAALNRATSDRAGLIYNGIRIAIANPVIGVGVGVSASQSQEILGGVREVDSSDLAADEVSD